MKKWFIRTMLFLSLVIGFPFNCLAQSYALLEKDITIDVPDDWYVFTRDNIKNNAELESLQIQYEYMKNMFESNYAYMDAFVIYDDGSSLEMFVRIKENNAIMNLSNYADEEVMELSGELAKNGGYSNYDVYVEDYKFAVSKYAQQDVNLIEYYTIVNGYGYTITFQKSNDYTGEEEKLIESIIDTIEFDVDEMLEEPVVDDFFDRIINWCVIGVLVGGGTGAVIGIIIAIKNKKLKK